jgi:hypothetical protein
MLNTLGKLRQSYIGKEKDVENGLGDRTSAMFILSLSKGSVQALSANTMMKPDALIRLILYLKNITGGVRISIVGIK